MKSRKTKDKGVNTMTDNNFEGRIVRLEVTQEHILAALAEIKSAIIAIDKKLDSRFDYLDKKIDRLDSRIWSLTFFMFFGFGSMLGVLAHAMHWI